MSVVPGKNVVLTIDKGAGEYQFVACNSSCSFTTGTDEIESTFLLSGRERNYLPGKNNSTLSGSGPVYLGTGVTEPEIRLMQKAGQIFAWRFAVTDLVGNNYQYSGSGFFTSIDITGEESNDGAPATCSYTIRVSGGVTVSAIPSSSDGDAHFFFYEAVGGETSVTLLKTDDGDAVALGATIIDFERSGDAIVVITSGTPTSSQVKHTPSTGALEFSYALGADEWIRAIFVT